MRYLSNAEMGWRGEGKPGKRRKGGASKQGKRGYVVCGSCHQRILPGEWKKQTNRLNVWRHIKCHPGIGKKRTGKPRPKPQSAACGSSNHGSCDPATYTCECNCHAGVVTT